VKDRRPSITEAVLLLSSLAWAVVVGTVQSIICNYFIERKEKVYKTNNKDFFENIANRCRLLGVPGFTLAGIVGIMISAGLLLLHNIINAAGVLDGTIF